MEYSELNINWGGQKFIFVACDKLPSKKEAIDYLNKRTQIASGKSNQETTLDASEQMGSQSWSVPENKQRRHIFMRDLRAGIDFCKEKYGVSEAEIIAEAKRIAPHYNIARA